MIPAGFQQMRPLDALIEAFAPVYAREAEGGVVLGFRVGSQHTNPRGNCHGGAWATMADVLLGLNIGMETGMSGPTISLAVDFLGPATVGQWVEGSARVLRHTPRTGFAECLFTTDGAPALRASAVFRRNVPGMAYQDILLRG